MEESMTNRQGKLWGTIMALPEQDVIWVCYNDDMIPYYEELIKKLRGGAYFEKYVKVVASGEMGNSSNTYLDPMLYELRGNGYD